MSFICRRTTHVDVAERRKKSRFFKKKLFAKVIQEMQMLFAMMVSTEFGKSYFCCFTSLRCSCIRTFNTLPPFPRSISLSLFPRLWLSVVHVIGIRITYVISTILGNKRKRKVKTIWGLLDTGLMHESCMKLSSNFRWTKKESKWNARCMIIITDMSSLSLLRIRVCYDTNFSIICSKL